VNRATVEASIARGNRQDDQNADTCPVEEHFTGEESKNGNGSCKRKTLTNGS